MFRCVARRRLAAGLVLLAVLAMAAPAQAAGRGVPLEPAGFVEQLAAWMAGVWSSAVDLLEEEPPAGIETLEGGCIIDPDGRCHGAIVPPAGEGS